ncbi:hypothetical protein CAEBREN_24768 [Caenorhabditis brenneri]|uniref:G-protein coupled receptors family 1 profile domain-containing protein n=1 Tax=Caenorhabditis brenneri TaxID=135651 RepID=G0MUC9_CAEBE|nr:hypothetical protein CAEBREN_24768 [Caenorhabditis brenneri]
MEIDLEFCMELYFPSFNEAARKTLCDFQKNILIFVSKTKPYESQISILVTLINLFHVLVLTRKSMRKSSINIIMAAVAFTDILSCFYQLNVYGQQELAKFGFCFDFYSYLGAFTDIVLSVLRGFARRCSTWLCFFIAVIRTSVVRNLLDSRFESLAEPKTALFLILGVLLTSCSISLFKWCEYSIASSEMNILSCGQWGTILFYYLQYSDWFIENDMFILKTFETTDAIISNVGGSCRTYGYIDRHFRLFPVYCFLS